MDDGISSEHQRLDDFLCSEAVDEEAMGLSELDGFLVGVIVSPDLIRPSEWMPSIWGERPPEFQSEAQAQEILGLIMGHYNGLIRELDEESFAPILDYFRDEALWALWIEGFWQAIRLRPDDWAALTLEQDDESLQFALFVLTRLSELATRLDDFEALDVDEELERLAPELIPLQVRALHRARIARDSAAPSAANDSFAKVGRNDPCPCGSGKKFKRCCLN